MLASLSLPEKQELLTLLEEKHRRLCRRDLTAWCIDALEPFDQTPAAVHRLIIRELEAVTRGETTRLMLLLPRGHGKSTYGSALFPPWFLAQKPHLRVVAASGTERLGVQFSYAAQRFVRSAGGVLGLSLDRENVLNWSLSNGGEYVTVGAGGQITGRRSDLVVLDDVVPGREAANSLLARDKVWQWWQGDVLGTLKPNGRVIVIMTHWHEDDFAGRLMQQEGNRWRVISLPAIAEGNSDLLGRMPGEALWPEWLSLDALGEKRAEIGEMEWAAQFQQRPRPLEGSLFKTGQIQVLDIAPHLHGATVARGWDLAATAQTGTRDPDWTAGVKMARLPSGLFVVLDVVRERLGPDGVRNLIRNIASQDGHGVKISLPQDPGQAGVAQALEFTRLLSGMNVVTSRETGEKSTRAAPYASQCNGGNVAVVRGPWNAAYLDELGSFPSGSKDDQVDASSRVFEEVGLGNRPLIVSDRMLQALGAR